MRHIWFVAALALVACDGGSKEVGTATAGAAAAVRVGAMAPNVTMTLHDGTSVTLESLKGSQVLLYFYPKDDTSG